MRVDFRQNMNVLQRKLQKMQKKLVDSLDMEMKLTNPTSKQLKITRMYQKTTNYTLD